MVYATLALSELALVFGMRSARLAAWRPPVNGWLVASTLGAAIFVAASIYLPPAHEPFATVSLGVWQAVLVAALALLPLVAVESLKALRRRITPASPPRAVGAEPKQAPASAATSQRTGVSRR
jgi:hypothetical protein